MVLLHGVASNMTRWSEFVARTRLRETWDLLRVDLRGHAGSLDRGRVGPDVWVADLQEILRAEAAPPPVVAGHCLGANVALAFAARAPARGLVLIEPMFRSALTGSLRTLARCRAVLGVAAAALRGVAALGVHRRRLVTLDLEALDREARAAMASAGGAFPEERYASLREDLRSMPTATYVQDLLAVTAPLPDPRSLSIPVLALLSEGGALSDPVETARRLAAFPRCEVARLPARHWIPTECPEAMRTSIERWCETVAAKEEFTRG